SWILYKLVQYAATHPAVLSYVYNKARVFVPDRPGVTNPEPDVAAYRDYPVDLDPDQLDWRLVSPILVIEVLSNDPDKDLTRNVELYLQVPTIREYWVIDTRQSAS